MSDGMMGRADRVIPLPAKDYGVQCEFRGNLDRILDECNPKHPKGQAMNIAERRYATDVYDHMVVMYKKGVDILVGLSDAIMKKNPMEIRRHAQSLQDHLSGCEREIASVDPKSRPYFEVVGVNPLLQQVLTQAQPRRQYGRQNGKSAVEITKYASTTEFVTQALRYADDLTTKHKMVEVDLANQLYAHAQQGDRRLVAHYQQQLELHERVYYQKDGKHITSNLALSYWLSMRGLSGMAGLYQKAEELMKHHQQGQHQARQREKYVNAR